MVDLRPWRVPVAVILLAAMAVRVGVSLVAAILASARSSGLFSSLAGGIGAGEIFLCVALAAVCWWCTADDVRGARGLAITAFVLVGAQILLSVGASLAMVPLLSGPDTRIVTVLIQLTWLVVPILAAAVLLRCALASDAVRRDTANASPAQALPAADPTDEPGGESEQAPPPYPEAAGWAPDEAAGAAWTSAGEAAKGGSAAGWGTGTETSWEPAAWSSDEHADPDPGGTSPEESTAPPRP